MATQSLLTKMAKVFTSEIFYFSPVFVSKTDPTIPLSSVYCYLAKTDTWVDDNNPPIPQEDQISMKKVFKNMFVMKQVYSNDISPVVKRIDWTSGETYDYYRDDIDILECHHLFDKNKDVSFMVTYAYSEKRILNELDKCEILCRNCHRKRHLFYGV